MVKQYPRGVKLEREVVNIFRKNGFQAVRSAGSHSEFDVILWKKGNKNKKIVFVAFVQCKVTADEKITEENLGQLLE